jgi:hypothetical protein
VGRFWALPVRALPVKCRAHKNQRRKNGTGHISVKSPL